MSKRHQESDWATASREEGTGCRQTSLSLCYLMPEPSQLTRSHTLEGPCPTELRWRVPRMGAFSVVPEPLDDINTEQEWLELGAIELLFLSSRETEVKFMFSFTL